MLKQPYCEPPLDLFEARRDALMENIVTYRDEAKKLGEYRKLSVLSDLHVLLDKAQDNDELMHVLVGVQRVARDLRSKSVP